MADLVIRLRLMPFAIASEAADEIEQLWEAIKNQGAEINRICEMALKDKAEIERLRAALQKIAEADSDDGLSAWGGSDIAREALDGH